MTQATAEMTPAQRLRKHLTHSQRIALRAVLGTMLVDEETINASAVADQRGITRSTLSHALDLAEVAGLAVTWNLGCSGTRVRLLDRTALEEAAR